MLLGIFAILVPVLSAALVPAAHLLGNKFRNAFAVASSILTAGIVLMLILQIKSGSSFSFEWLPNINVGICLDALSINLACVAAVIGSLIVLYSVKYMEKEDGLLRYYSLVLLFIGAMIGLVLSDNFLTLYIFWEIVGLCSYALIGFFYRDPKAVRAGIKAFITTRIGDVGLLIGILLLYVYTGTFNIAEIATKAPLIPAAILAVAAFGFMLGAIGKSAQVPLHVWLPDAMEAPTTISALIHAATMVNAGIYLMARVFPIFHGVPYWAATLAWVGAITALLSASMALVENDLKRILAYSTVSQLGFMMFSIGVGGLFASQFHLMSHAIFKALLFLCAGSIIHAVGTRDINQMGGLLKKMKITAVCFGAGALALMGIPILNGFFSKDLILAAGYASNNYVPFILICFAAVFTILYSLRTFSKVFLGSEASSHAHDAPWQMTLPLVALAAASLISWLLGPVFSEKLMGSGIQVEHLVFSEFMKEIFLSPVTMISLGIITVGLLSYYYRKTIINGLAVITKPYLLAARSGFWFDKTYTFIIDSFIAASKFTGSFFDEGILNRFNYAVGNVFFSFSASLRKVQTGELNLNIAGMVFGIATVIWIIVWRR